MNERDLMDPDLRRRSSTTTRPRTTSAPDPRLDPQIEPLIQALCRSSRIAYCTGDRTSWAGEMRHHLHAGRSQGRWETARLDCVIFSGLVRHGMNAAGSGLSMRRAVSVREQLLACGYDIRRETR